MLYECFSSEQYAVNAQIIVIFITGGQKPHYNSLSCQLKMNSAIWYTMYEQQYERCVNPLTTFNIRTIVRVMCPYRSIVWPAVFPLKENLNKKNSSTAKSYHLPTN